MRGGSNLLEPLQYEEEITSEVYQLLIPFPQSILNNKQLFVRLIFKKCFRQNHSYLLTNKTVIAVVEKMMGFKKHNINRIISYYVLIYG